ncbi:conserved hypothetical protein [Xanthomonas campestris pv. raphani 756C]|nr:conserved hypothetical protein [Xanthomonas campestris pv. raphani 756C]
MCRRSGKPAACRRHALRYVASARRTAAAGHPGHSTTPLPAAAVDTTCNGGRCRAPPR